MPPLRWSFQIQCSPFCWISITKNEKDNKLSLLLPSFPASLPAFQRRGRWVANGIIHLRMFTADISVLGFSDGIPRHGFGRLEKDRIHLSSLFIHFYPFSQSLSRAKFVPDFQPTEEVSLPTLSSHHDVTTPDEKLSPPTPEEAERIISHLLPRWVWMWQWRLAVLTVGKQWMRLSSSRESRLYLTDYKLCAAR